MRTATKLSFGFAATALPLIFAACPALAQSAPAAAAAQPNAAAPAGANEVETIVVTAQRVSQNIEKVPLAITALSQNQLDDRHIQSDLDLQTAVPGLIAEANNTPNDIEFTLRGQSVDANTGSAPAVQVYINDAPANALTSNVFYDMSSVQVLKGPQGTLFGRNTTGGAVLYETQKPTSEFGGYAELGGGNLAMAQGTLVVNLPVNDMVLIRIAGQDTSRDGYQYNYFNGQHLGSVRQQTGRVSVTLKPISALESTSTFEYTKNGGTAADNVLYSVYKVGQTNGGVPLNPIAAELFGNPALPYGGIFGALQLQQKRGPFTANSDQPSVYDTYNWQFDNTTSYELSPNLTVKNIFSVTTGHDVQAQSVTGDPFGIFLLESVVAPYADQHLYANTLSEEFQIVGHALDGKLDYVAGAYFDYQLAEFATYSKVFQALPNDFGAKTGAHSQAGYGQGTYDLSSLTGVNGLKFTAGIRYTYEEEELKGGVPPAGDTFTRPSNIHETIGFSNPSWQVGLNWQADPNFMLYVVTRGSWRSGGFSPAAPSIAAPAQQGGNIFDPETTRDVEIGLKYHGSQLGVPAELNVALYNQWTYGVQRVEYLASNLGVDAYTINIPSGITQGIEADGVIRPTKWLEFGGAVAYTNAYFSNGNTVLYNMPYHFGPWPEAPRWSGSVYGKVYIPVPDQWGQMAVRAEVFGQSTYYFTSLNNTINPESQLPGFALLNLHFDWRHIYNSHASLSLYATNVTDQRYYLGGIGVGAELGANAAVPGVPQMYGATVRYEF